MVEIPILGRTFAGSLTMAHGNPADPDYTLSVTQNMLPRGARMDDLFALEVRGNSMIEAHINSGDFIVVKRSETANNGEMVVVFLDDENETTLKYFFREENRIRLEPANSKMNAIIIEGDRSLRILGKVVQVVRQ